MNLARIIHDSSATIGNPLLRQTSGRRARPSDFDVLHVRLRSSGLRASVSRRSLAISPRTVMNNASLLSQEKPSLSMASVAEQIVQVTLGERSYNIALHPGLLASVGDRLKALATSSKIGVVTDRHVASRYLQGVLR